MAVRARVLPLPLPSPRERLFHLSGKTFGNADCCPLP
jgi:hypothetical protein